MIEINVVNFLTIGIMAMIFFAAAELVKKKMGWDKDDVKPAGGA